MIKLFFMSLFVWAYVWIKIRITLYVAVVTRLCFCLCHSRSGCKILFKPLLFKSEFMEPNVFSLNFVQRLMMGKQENGLSRKTAAGRWFEIGLKKKVYGQEILEIR